MAKSKPKRPQGARKGPSTYRPGWDPAARDTFARGRPDPLYDFRAQLTPATARGAIDAAAGLRYGGAEAQLADQMRGVGQRFQNVGNWFDQYKSDIDKSMAAQQAYYKGAQDANAQLVSQAAAQAPVQGPQTAQGQADSKNAASVRQGLAEAFGQLLTSQLGTEQAYLGDRRNVGSAAQLSERLKSDQMMRDLERQGGQLAREKGDFKTTYAGELRDSERTYADTLHRQGLERQAFGLDVQKAQNDVISDQADREARAQSESRKRRQQLKDQKTRRGQQIADRNYRAEHDRSEDNRIAKVREKSAKALNRIEEARGKWDSYAKVGAKPQKEEKWDPVAKKWVHTGRTIKPKLTPDKLRAQLQKEGYLPAEIHLALMDRAGKKWGPKELEMAKQLGIRVPRDRIAKPRKPSRADRYSKGGGRPD